MKIVFHCRDDKNFKIDSNDFVNMDDFFLKNMVIDIYGIENNIDNLNIGNGNGDNENNEIININEDMIIVKSIVDSIRLKTLIYSNQVNLRYMKALCDKWCCPDWLLDMINDEINDDMKDRKLVGLIHFIKELFGETNVCKICHNGFKINQNGPQSCRGHFCNTTIANSNNYSCCNKEEPCIIGYHVPEISSTSTTLINIINTIKDLL